MDLSSLRLEQIPLELICRCVTRGIRITEIDLSNNLLTTLTQHFCIFFPEIEVLEMRRNQLKKLPDNFGNLTSLRRLNLENNKIKRLPDSFANLVQLEWLNLSNNPLDGDLVEIIGTCSNDVRCAEAAINAVRYVHFSSSLPMESTAIADSSSQSQMPTNDSSSSSRQTTPESLTEFEKMEKRNKYRRSSEAEHISQDRWIFCSTNTVFVWLLVALFALAIPLWLTFDSMRDSYVNQEFAADGTNKEKNTFLTHISQLLTEGKFPDCWCHFMADFATTFRKHWAIAVNKPLAEKVKSLEFRRWADYIISCVKLTVFMLWQLLLPAYRFFADYLANLWFTHVQPVLQAWIR